MAQIDYTWWCDASLPDHPKVHRLAEALRVSDLEAIGVIASLFCRVRRHAPSGDLSAIPERTLTLWGGHKRVTFAALSEAGWIDSDKHVHGWSERYAEADAKRQRDIERKREFRRGNGAGTAPPRRARDADESAPRARNGAAAARNGAGDRDGDVDVKKEQQQGAVAPPPKLPAAPPDPRIAEVRTSYETAYTERFGRPPTVTNHAKLGAQIRLALKAVGGEDPVGEITSLLSAYLDLSETDEFYRGAPLGKMLSGDTLARLRAPAVRPRETPAERKRREASEAQDALWSQPIGGPP